MKPLQGLNLQLLLKQFKRKIIDMLARFSNDLTYTDAF